MRLAVALVACFVMVVVSATERQHHTRKKGGEHLPRFASTEKGPFLSNLASVAGGFVNSMASNLAQDEERPPTAADREGCFGCELIMRQVHTAVGNGAIPPTTVQTTAALEDMCAFAPPVFDEACEAMRGRKSELVREYLSGKTFREMCETAQLCWPGLMVEQ